MRRVAGILVLLFAFLPAVAQAQGGAIRGRVTDAAGQPLARATILIDGSALNATSNDQGRYEIRGVSPGTYTVRARLLGFVSQAARVTVADSGVVQDFTLAEQAISLSPVDVVVGSRARHTAAEELAVPVDVFTAEEIAQQGTNETSQILQNLAPSVNFPRQSVTDANDIVRPFTLRGLSPDHTLVLLNGWRRHQMAVLNTFAYGMGAGSSGVDLNALPGGAIDRIEVLRDGAAAQYGSDAIAGVVNLVLKEGGFAPFVNAGVGQYSTDATNDYLTDGTSVDVQGGFGVGVGAGSLSVFGEYLHREPTNRAWADSFPLDPSGADVIDPNTGRVIQKVNGVAQPNYHWGDGLEKDAMGFANFRMPLNQGGTSELYAFGGYSHREGTGNGFWRYYDSNRNWPQLYPDGFLPQFRPDVVDLSGVAGFRANVSGWSLDLGVSYGKNRFDYNLENTNNPSLGPCLVTACAPGADRILGNTDDPGIPNQLSFFAGRLERREGIVAVNLAKSVNLGLAAPVNVALGAAYRREGFKITAGETASWINGNHLAQDSSGPAPAGSSVFPGFAPSDAGDHGRSNVGVFADLEAQLSPQFLANVAARFESYSDFGENINGKVALRFQPAQQFVLRGAASTGFRAPGLSQSFFSHTTTNVIGGQFIEVGNFPVSHPASRIFGAQPLKEETSVNLSAGFALTPRDNLTFTVDFFHITIDNRILLGATFGDSVSQAILADSGFSNIGAVQFFTNGLNTRTNGVDITGDLRLAAGAGTLGLNLGVNYAKNEITRVDPLPEILQGTPTELTSILDLVTEVGIEEERPDWRGTLAATYTVGRWHALSRFSYFGGFASAQPSFTDRETYSGKTLVDVEAGYQFSSVNLSIGARNLLDVYPDKPRAQFNNNDNTFPWAAASPFGYNGRYLYARAEVRFSR
ncbi:MAG TPA: TonB-dependent receptor [Gemmatimonadales bacterium]|nr:TonB-dependent receptor [Gemmatimonadales bacterium]